MNIICILDNGTKIFFDKGRFDSWCVYVKTKNDKVYIPLDKDYFLFFQKLSKEYSIEKVYDDFLSIYKAVSNSINNDTLKMIKKISNTYKKNIQEIELNFIIIYSAMVSERNKKNTILKEKIKHLGFYQTVVEGFLAEKAAVFSKGMKASEILQICKSKGIN
ncbi:hypothetical protein OAJ75_02535 [Candidatus Pelagibacter sp.]|nr:hypothetical protein [Candidatus Pelagibacter sp.]